jgi:hypothetical protein
MIREISFRIRRAFWMILFCVTWSGMAFADGEKVTIHLKNGDVYSGKMKEANASHIELETQHGRIRIPWNDIQAEEQNSLKRSFLNTAGAKTQKLSPTSDGSVPQSLILPVIVKAKGIVGKKGQWDSYYDPDVFDFVQKASVEIQLKNGTRSELRDLRLIYFVFAIADFSRDQYVAGAGHHDFHLDKLASLTYRTDKLFFYGERTAFEYLPNYRAGDKYYGYVVTVWQGDNLAGFYANPRSLQKLKLSAKSLKDQYLKTSEQGATSG